ncbi:ankyrin repeat-containing protein [Xylariaceae sp. FL0255]|nr:ankyrin repeat-containing protein [Xylariaceae sp. FL0255]
MAPNPFLLAADDSPGLLPLLRENPALASLQDDHGYSLVHAAASYNHLDLLRALIRELNVDVNLQDEDSETALFVVETIDAAKVLVEELGIDVALKADDGCTALERIEGEGDFPEVAEYLRAKETGQFQSAINGESSTINGQLPPAPEGLNVTVGTMTAEEAGAGEVDPEFRRRIEELAERQDFHTDAGQAELRQLVQDALTDGSLTDRNVRPRQG